MAIEENPNYTYAMALKVYKAEVGKSEPQRKWGTIAKSGSKTKAETEVDLVDLEEASDMVEAGEVAKVILPEEEETVEEVEVIPEEVNFNRFLELSC